MQDPIEKRHLLRSLLGQAVSNMDNSLDCWINSYKYIFVLDKNGKGKKDCVNVADVSLELKRNNCLLTDKMKCEKNNLYKIK